MNTARWFWIIALVLLWAGTIAIMVASPATGWEPRYRYESRDPSGPRTGSAGRIKSWHERRQERNTTGTSTTTGPYTTETETDGRGNTRTCITTDMGGGIKHKDCY